MVELNLRHQVEAPDALGAAQTLGNGLERGATGLSTALSNATNTGGQGEIFPESLHRLLHLQSFGGAAAAGATAVAEHGVNGKSPRASCLCSLNPDPIGFIVVGEAVELAGGGG